MAGRTIERVVCAAALTLGAMGAEAGPLDAAAAQAVSRLVERHGEAERARIERGVAQVARYWAQRDCPVVIHVDKRTPAAKAEKLRADLADLPNIRFSPRHACEWGTWGIVAATQAAGPRRNSVVPPLLDAAAAYEFLSRGREGPTA